MNGQLYDITDVIDTYVFRSLLSGTDMGMTAAATLYQSVMCFVIINIANAVVKKIDPDYALFWPERDACLMEERVNKWGNQRKMKQLS